MRAAAVLCLLLAACAPAPRDDTSGTAEDAATAADTAPAGDAGIAPDDAWPVDGPVDYRRVRPLDLTGDGSVDTVIVTARGPAYDSLDIALTITGAAGDTLWREAWPSLLYFKYDPVAGKPDSTVRAMVRDHIEQLTASDRFTMSGGLPAVLSRGGDPDATMREAIHYHLAELDWRRAAGLSPAVATPPDAHSEITTDSVPAPRVDEVLVDVRESPTFMYYAGGEATYAIAWSEREQAFVRIYSCC
jgi:hypothetical protein